MSQAMPMRLALLTLTQLKRRIAAWALLRLIANAPRNAPVARKNLMPNWSSNAKRSNPILSKNLMDYVKQALLRCAQNWSSNNRRRPRKPER